MPGAYQACGAQRNQSCEVVIDTDMRSADPYGRAPHLRSPILDLWLEHPHAGSMVLGCLMTDPATQHLPVIISSAYRQLLDAEAAHLQARGYLIVDKPYRIGELLAAVHTLLSGTDAAPGRRVVWKESDE